MDYSLAEDSITLSSRLSSSSNTKNNNTAANRTPLIGSSIQSIFAGRPDTISFDIQAFLEGSSKKPKAEDAFPYKVLKFLNNNSSDNNNNINNNNKGMIQWCPHGRAFLISNQSKFEEHVLSGIKYKSFVRLLNMWGFKRITQGADRGTYYHQFFLRGKEFLIQFMQCEKNKGIGRRSSPNPQDEPDFYALAKYRPLDNNQHTAAANYAMMRSHHQLLPEPAAAPVWDNTPDEVVNFSTKHSSSVEEIKNNGKNNDASSSTTMNNNDASMAASSPPSSSSSLAIMNHPHQRVVMQQQQQHSGDNNNNDNNSPYPTTTTTSQSSSNHGHQYQHPHHLSSSMNNTMYDATTSSSGRPSQAQAQQQLLNNNNNMAHSSNYYDHAPYNNGNVNNNGGVGVQGNNNDMQVNNQKPSWTVMNNHGNQNGQYYHGM